LNRPSINSDFEIFTTRVRKLVNHKFKDVDPSAINSFNKKLQLPYNRHDGLTPSYSVASIESFLKQKKVLLNNLVQRAPVRFNQQTDKMTLTKWFKENDVIIKQTDKNLGIAIISVKDYHVKVMEQLDNNLVYQKLDFMDWNRILDQYSKVTRSILTKDRTISLKGINKQESTFLQITDPNSYILPQFHLIPKIHKDPWVGRPIVSSLKWITRNVAIVLNVYLESYAKSIPTILKDSKQLVQLLDGIHVTDDTNFFSLDAISMYTNIPLRRTFATMRKYPTTFPEYIVKGLEFCVENNLFQYMGQIYKQLDGIPMGINFAVAFANISVFLLIESSPKLIRFLPNIVFWGRYIDDCNGLWKGSYASFLEFHQTMNQIDDSIQWTIGEFGKRVVYLDLLAQINVENKVYFELYQKKLNKYLYLPFHSHHTLATKKGWIKGELIRLARNSSFIDSFQSSCHKLFKRLSERGYPGHFITDIFDSFDYSTRSSLLIMEKIDFNNTPLTEIEIRFKRKIQHFHKKSTIKFGVKQDTLDTMKLVFSTSFNSIVPSLRLHRNLNPLPAFTTDRQFDATEITIAYRIDNKLSSIFNHNSHNIKIRAYLDQNRQLEEEEDTSENLLNNRRI
jgi:hypothetical protein